MGANGSADDINAMEIHHWYTKFMKECPSGQLCLHEFKHVLGLQSLTQDANKYVEQVFHTFDMNKHIKQIAVPLKVCSDGDAQRLQLRKLVFTIFRLLFSKMRRKKKQSAESASSWALRLFLQPERKLYSWAIEHFQRRPETDILMT
nr:neurocalcin-delta A-like [Chelonoidis abingdonii]